jgi:two-component system chemotaxis response regulator CheB
MEKNDSKINVLIVDDSLIFRRAIEESLMGEDDIRVVGSVRNGVKAIEFINTSPIRPGLVTLDVEMPDMDGLETLVAIRKINASRKLFPPIGVIMVSSHTHKGADTTIRALETGAFDFIAKPQGGSPEQSIDIIRRQLLVKIRYYVSVFIYSRNSRAAVPAGPKSDQIPPAPPIECILIGVSTGGPKALASILPAICDHSSVPILIVQHMPRHFTRSLADSLNKKCRYAVREARNNEMLETNHIYIAPGDQHMLVRRINGKVRIVLNDQPPENGSRPSVDVLFRSASIVYGPDVLAIILTGMGTDGTKGSGAVKRAGGHVIAQDESTSVVWGMPGSAVSSGNVDAILPLDEIPESVLRITGSCGRLP